MFRHRKNTCFILYLSVNVTVCSLTICYLRTPYGYTIMYTCLLLSPKISSAIASDKDCTEHSFKLCHSNTLSQLSRSDIFFFLKQSKICGSVYKRTYKSYLRHLFQTIKNFFSKCCIMLLFMS